MHAQNRVSFMMDAPAEIVRQCLTYNGCPLTCPTGILPARGEEERGVENSKKLLPRFASFGVALIEIQNAFVQSLYKRSAPLTGAGHFFLLGQH